MFQQPEIKELSAETMQKAFIELNENIETRQSFIEQMRMEIQSQDLRGCVDDFFLLRFLRAKKFDLAAALKLYNSYYGLRIHYKDIFHDLRPSRISYMFLDGVISCLPDTDLSGRAVIYFKPANWDHSKYPINDIFRASILTVEYVLLNWPEMQIHGVVLLIDLTGFTWHHAWRMLKPQFINCAAKFMQGSTPMRVKAVHVINEPVIFGKIHSALGPLLKPKNRHRIKVYGNSLTNLHAVLPPHILPSNCGLRGTGPPIPCPITVNKVLSLESYCQYMNQFPHHIRKSRLRLSTNQWPIQDPYETSDKDDQIHNPY